MVPGFIPPFKTIVFVNIPNSIDKESWNRVKYSERFDKEVRFPITAVLEKQLCDCSDVEIILIAKPTDDNYCIEKFKEEIKEVRKTTKAKIKINPKILQIPHTETHDSQKEIVMQAIKALYKSTQVIRNEIKSNEESIKFCREEMEGLKYALKNNPEKLRKEWEEEQERSRDSWEKRNREQQILRAYYKRLPKSISVSKNTWDRLLDEFKNGIEINLDNYEEKENVLKILDEIEKDSEEKKRDWEENQLAISIDCGEYEEIIPAKNPYEFEPQSFEEWFDSKLNDLHWEIDHYEYECNYDVEFYADITYASKSMSIITSMIKNFAEKFFGCKIENFVCGEKTESGYKMLDMAGLFYFDSFMGRIKTKNPDDAIELLDNAFVIQDKFFSETYERPKPIPVHSEPEKDRRPERRINR